MNELFYYIFKSPTRLTTNLFTVPLSSLIVKTSNKVCVGCSPSPSPAFIISIF